MNQDCRAESGPEGLSPAALLTPELQVRWEIWSSFVSMLRAYAALAGPEFSVHTTADWAKVGYQGRCHCFCFQPAGEGSAWVSQWPEGAKVWGSWRLHTDGTLDFGNGPEALDMVAIEWIDKLRQQHLFDGLTRSLDALALEPTSTTAES